MGKFYNIIDEEGRFTIRDNKIMYYDNDKESGQYDTHTYSYKFVREMIPEEERGLEKLVEKE